ncbi:MAG: molybdenum cofactor guanylyltransferase [Planctomycetes bacterium]|nr:molybdenum cofactor guanylyltransferase [Planctomycetota bacterium]
MGRAKESLPIGDTTMLGWQCRTLLACAAPVVVVGRDRGQELPPLPADVDIALDEMPGEGPLAAIAAGLRRLRDRHGFDDDDAAITVGCDQPFLTAAIVRGLAAHVGDADVLMPRENGKLQPLTAVYRIRILAAADRLLGAGARRPRELADEAHGRIVEADELRHLDPELRFLRNLNHPDDYRDALRLLAGG